MTWARRWLIPLSPAVYGVLLLVGGKVRVEWLVLGIAALLLMGLGEPTRRVLRAVAPLLLVAVGYDAMRYLIPAFVDQGRVLSCGLRRVDLAWFGVGANTTFGEFLSSHHGPLLDLFFAVPYTIFLYVVAGYGVYLYFHDSRRMHAFLWAFSLANCLAFLLWLALPAAPPWYVHLHGCDVDLHAHGNPAGLARVDAELGIHYFHAFYARSTTVFGAIPSMHCAYPMLGLLNAFPSARWRERTLHGVYVVWMFLAALYLEHHWVVDALVGWTVAVAAVLLARRLLGSAPQTLARS